MEQKIQQFLETYPSEFTRKNYQIVLNIFLDQFKTLPEDNLWINDYIAHLKKRKMSNKTINYHLTIISKFLQWSGKGKLEYTRLKEIPVKTDFLTKEEVEKLLKNTEMPFLAILMFLIDTGCRVGELEHLSKQNFSSIDREIIVMGKGQKQRVVIISRETQRLLGRIMKNGYIFGKPWTVRQIQYHLKRSVGRAGIKKNVYCHMLRHTFATHMLWSGSDIQDIKAMLGHSYLSTTERYTHITQERVKQLWMAKQDNK